MAELRRLGGGEGHWEGVLDGNSGAAGVMVVVWGKCWTGDVECGGGGGGGGEVEG